MEVSACKLHFFYVALILTLCIIGLVTARVGDAKPLVDYVTFAATLSSLILAVLAIIYSMTSNAGLGGTLAAIQDASSRLSTKVEALSQLTKTIEAIPTKLDAIGKDTSAMRNQLNESQPIAPVAKSAPPTAQLNQGVQAFFMRCSHSGVFITYAAALAARSGKPLDPKAISAALDNICDPGYIYGFIVATGSAGLFNTVGMPPAVHIASALPDIEEAAAQEAANRAKAHPELMTAEKIERWSKAIRALF